MAKMKIVPAPQLLAADRTRIGDIMTRGAVTVPADLGLEQLVDLFLEQDLSRVPVVDDDGRVVGVVSKTDLVIDQHARGDTEVSQLGASGRAQHVHEVSGLVRDVMTPVAFTLPATTTIGEAARRMLADHVHAMPVTSDDGHVIGLLSATDIMAWVAGVQFEQPAAATPTR
jgi:CBS-domain-containing membrane protein